MSSFYLHLEAKPGSDIDNCASEALRPINATTGEYKLARGQQ